MTCEACLLRPAAVRIVWPDEGAVLCGPCLDVARDHDLLATEPPVH